MTATEAPENQARPQRPRNDPLVVGGMSMSGRRSIARLLREWGLQLPGPLSDDHVSDWFTLLFRRHSWAKRLGSESRPISDCVDEMRVLGAMLNGARLDFGELSLLAEAAAEVAASGYETQPDLPWWAPEVPFRLVSKYLATPPATNAHAPWGWSHPVAHLFLEEIATAFPQTRFIYAVRHPLDSALASHHNLPQLRMWDRLSGLDDRSIDASPASAQLAFWLYSTRSTTEAGDRLLGDRFMLVWDEQLYKHPAGVAGRLAAFAGLAPNQAVLKGAAKLVEKPAGMGDWRGHRFDDVDPALIQRAHQWGHAVELEPAVDS
jgi:hypothetical protein